jgi:hypothetical protein
MARGPRQRHHRQHPTAVAGAVGASEATSTKDSTNPIRRRAPTKRIHPRPTTASPSTRLGDDRAGQRRELYQETGRPDEARTRLDEASTLRRGTATVNGEADERVVDLLHGVSDDRRTDRVDVVGSTGPGLPWTSWVATARHASAVNPRHSPTPHVVADAGGTPRTRTRWRGTVAGTGQPRQPLR